MVIVAVGIAWVLRRPEECAGVELEVSVTVRLAPGL